MAVNYSGLSVPELKQEVGEEFIFSRVLPYSIFSNQIQAKKKGITWIKASYLRKIDFVAVLESADSLAEAGLKILLTTTELIHFAQVASCSLFPLSFRA